MECLSDSSSGKIINFSIVDNNSMALSYDRRSEALSTTLLLQQASQFTGMKQEPVDNHHRHHHHHHHQGSSSPPLTKPGATNHNNNNNNNNNHHLNCVGGGSNDMNSATSAAVHVAASAMSLTDINAAAMAMGMCLPTPQQIALQSAFLANLHANLPVAAAAAAAGNPYMFGGLFCPQSASSPPPMLPQQPRSPGPVSPALSTKSVQSSRKTPLAQSLSNLNNNSSCHNNNVSKPKKARLSRSHHHKHEVTGRCSPADHGPVIKEPAAPPATTTTTTSSSGGGGGGRDKTFTCQTCNRSFGYKHVLQNHERTHTGEKPFKCPECNKRFTRDHHLKTHMRLHTGEKPYHCTHCDRQFVQVANLRRHLRVHTGERPYTCNICQSKFSDSNQLKSHQMTHRSAKPFRCEHCNAGFRRRHHFLGHKCSGLLPSNLVAAHLGNPSTVAAAPAAAGSSSSRSRTPISEDELDYEMMDREFASPDPSDSLPLNLTCELPEQTEPEDLSMPASRPRDTSTGSPVSCGASSEDEEPNHLSR